VAESFKIERAGGPRAIVLRLFILDQPVPVATAYLRRAKDGEITSRKINWSSGGYVSLEESVAMVEGLAALVLRSESET
jgi:hypothetical protein